MFVIFAIFLGLACYPTPIKAQTVKVQEDAKPGDFVFNHTRDSVNACVITSTDIKKTYFHFNDTILYVLETPDLELDEVLCNKKTIAVKYSCLNQDSNNVTYTAYIRIEAIDEFDPVFDPLTFYTIVKEEESKGTKVQFENGTDIDFRNYISDKDCGDNEFKFQLHDNQRGIFSISGSSIVTNKVIDFENDDHIYNLTLLAENDPDDSTQATKNASSIVSIFIKDIDDMNPLFNHPAYTLHVTEEDSSFVNVELIVTPHDLAYDQDFGINQTLNYMFADTVETFISMSADNGAISLSRKLDREVNASYSFQIKAVQNDSEQRFAVSQLNLIVDDINDNHAVFDTTSLDVIIQENLAAGSFVQVVQALDADEGTNAQFSYVISDGALQVDPATGIISVFNSSALDRETNDKLTFQISTIPATEVHSDKPCPNCNITLNVKLSDVNDNDPIFDSPSFYVFNVENNVLGEIVGKVFATDADIGKNALVMYSIESPTTDFSINSSSGEITLASQTTLPTTILVKACDSPSIISLRRCSIVQVNVQSKDNSSITGTDIVAAVFENLPGDSFVAEVPFYSNQFKFELQTNDKFKLIKNLIKTRVALDREDTQYYSLQLNVSGGSQVQSYLVNITVKDFNDNAPVFDQDKYFFSLTENMTPGSPIGTVKATDIDDIMNANVTYYIEGQTSKYFSISTTGGLISLLMMPDIGLTQQFLSLVVIAADSGQPSLQNLADVQIQVGLSNGTLRIPVGAEKQTIIDDQINYERSLTDILGVKTVINETSKYGAGSVIYISSTNVTDQSEIPLFFLNRLAESNMVAIQALFMRKQQSVPPRTINGMSSEAIALIAVACVLFVGSILLTAVTYYKFKRYQRLQRLVHNLSRKNSIYETQETSIAIEDEISEYERQDSISTQNLIIDDKTSSSVPNGQVAGVDNPGYDADALLAQEAPTEPELDYLNADLVQPTTPLDTLDNEQEEKLENDSNVNNLVNGEPDTDDVDHESIEDSVNDDLVNNHKSTEDPVNDDFIKHEEITNVIDEDTYVRDTDKSNRFFVPTPPPLPDIFPSLSKSSSSSELKDITHKIPADSSKSPHYQNVLLELCAAVKKRSDGEEDVEDEPEVEPVPKCVPKVCNENLTGSLEVIDLDEADLDDLSTSSNLNNVEEPEPDYAKRVRFNENDNKNEITPPKVKKAEDSDDEQPHLGHDLRNTEEIKSPDDSLNGETGTFVFGQVEITEF